METMSKYDFSLLCIITCNAFTILDPPSPNRHTHTPIDTRQVCTFVFGLQREREGEGERERPRAFLSHLIHPHIIKNMRGEESEIDNEGEKGRH